MNLINRARGILELEGQLNTLNKEGQFTSPHGILTRYGEVCIADVKELCEAVIEANRLIGLYVSDASDGRAMECGEWLSKYASEREK